MQANAKEARPGFVYLALGMLQGGATYATLQLWSAQVHWQPLLSVLLAFLLITTLQLQLLWSVRRTWPVPVLIAGSGVLFALLAYRFTQQAADSAPGEIAALAVLGAVLLLYILLPFIQSLGVRGGWRYRYEDLYQFAWSNGPIIALAGLLVGVFWLVLLLWSGLFSMVGIGLFAEVFSSPLFACVATPVFFALGVRIGLLSERVIDSLRGILLAVCRLLMPCTVLIILLFLLCLPFTGLEPLWNTGRAAPILFGLIAVHLLFVNGVYQDGRQQLNYLPLARRLLSISLLSLPVLALAACYGLWLRINQYGLTPSRVLGSALLLVTLLYALAMAVAVMKQRSGWLANLRHSNPPIALFTAALLVLLQSPVLNPLELSARDQFQRLLDGRVNAQEMDLAELRFGLGEPGRRYLQRIEALVEGGRGLSAELRDGLKPRLITLSQSQNAYEAKRKEQQAQSEYQWLGQPQAGMVEWLRNSHETGGGCTARTCYLWAVDLDHESGKEVLLWAGGERDDQPEVYTRRASGEWQLIGRLRDFGSGAKAPGSALEAVRQEHVQVVEPTYQALKLGGRHFEMDRYR